jgi:ribosomal protein S18 acetylase RimI-like enzyme
MTKSGDRTAFALAPFDADSRCFGDVARMYNEVWGGDNKEYALLRHVEYPGFKGVVALTERGEVAGAVYGYTDLPGQWWHNHVAAMLGREATDRWLTGSFSVTELAIVAAYRRQGLGRLLLRTVLTGLAQTTATLSTQLDNAPARALYASEGWRPLVEHMRFDPVGAEYVILRRDLP